MAEDEDPHPDGWPAQARKSFLTAVWNMVVDEDAYTDGYPSWIDSWLRGHRQGNARHPVAGPPQILHAYARHAAPATSNGTAGGARAPEEKTAPKKAARASATTRGQDGAGASFGS
jgi:hypothetical protein